MSLLVVWYRAVLREEAVINTEARLLVGPVCFAG